MICRHPTHGQKLDVAGLNEITVLIDRSETELTEVAMNSWSPGLDGPPHAHDQKEQNFLVTSGTGEVIIGTDRFPAAPGDFFYVPARVVHQTINRGIDRLEYFLFNAFLDATKEGHASFADHIGKVKETRRRQAEQQRAEPDGSSATATKVGRRGRRVERPAAGGGSTVILVRSDTERCEAVAWQLARSEHASIAPDATKEQTLFVFSGEGAIQVGVERVAVHKGNAIFVPRGSTCALEAGPSGLDVISFGTVVAR